MIIVDHVVAVASVVAEAARNGRRAAKCTGWHHRVSFLPPLPPATMFRYKRIFGHGRDQVSGWNFKQKEHTLGRNR
jgi:hypothetical protein